MRGCLESVHDQAEAWEAVYLTAMEDASATLPSPWSLAYFSTRSFADEFGAEINNDITLLFVSLPACIVSSLCSPGRVG